MNVLMISVKEKKNLNHEALNILVGGIEQPFLKCNYEFTHGKHQFCYETIGAMPLCGAINVLGVATVAEQLCMLIQYVQRHQLHLSNIVLRKKHLFMQDRNFKFVYLPVAENEYMDVEEFVGRFLKCIGKKKLFTYIYTQVLQGLERGLVSTSIEEDKIGTTLLGEDEAGTSLLESVEEGTTLLSEQHDESDPQMYELHESETSVLSMQSRPFNSDSEGETTLFSAQPDTSNEGETTLFSVQQDEKKEDLIFLRNSTGERVYIYKTPFVFGKDPNRADFVLENRSASRVHATINYQNGEYYITDNGSTNGTIVEGSRLAPNKLEAIDNASLISFGTETFQAIIERR